MQHNRALAPDDLSDGMGSLPMPHYIQRYRPKSPKDAVWFASVGGIASAHQSLIDLALMDRVRQHSLLLISLLFPLCRRHRASSYVESNDQVKAWLPDRMDLDDP